MYYEYDYNNVCHENFITAHSLAYRLGYHEAIVSITQSYHKAIIAPVLSYQCINHYTLNKYKLHLQIFSLLMYTVNNMYDIYSAMYYMGPYGGGTLTGHWVNL